jgi:hypothetical protein
MVSRRSASTPRPAEVPIRTFVIDVRRVVTRHLTVVRLMAPLHRL